MKTFREIIEGMPEEHWNYYNQLEKRIEKPKCFSESSSFIEQYFNNAEKAQIFGMEDNFSVNTSIKSEHSVSVYFLGCYFAAQFKLTNLLVLQKDSIKGYSDHFLFVWFLSCLFHDHYFDIEKSSKCINFLELISSNDIQHLLIDRGAVFIPQKLKESINKYYEYRQEVWKVNDHGITAGLLLFDKLVKIRIESEKRISSLDFSKPIENLYKEAAFAIATHNIFFPTKDNEKTYTDYQLNNLIGHPRIKLNESPFLFLLGLVDTIDPVKTYNCLAPDFVAEKVQIKTVKNKLGYNIHIKIEKPLESNLLLEKIKGVDKWLAIEVSSDNDLIIIKIPA